MLRQILKRLEVTPREKAPRTCGDEAMLSGRGPSQMGWYAFISEVVQGHSVLDVGCGSGEGLKILSARATHALGIDLDDRLRRPDVNVEIKSVSDVPADSFDYVVCLDVIEHVEADRAFVSDLVRVARKGVFVTTPNYAMSFNRNPYHVREYTPAEFEHLFESAGDVTVYGGTSKGREYTAITRPLAYRTVCALYCWKPTLPLAKVLKRVLGVKMWAHQGVLVNLKKTPSASAAAAA